MDAGATLGPRGLLCLVHLSSEVLGRDDAAFGESDSAPTRSETVARRVAWTR